MDEKVTVIAQLKAKIGKVQAAKELLGSLIGPTRKEAGCIDYYLHQGQQDESRFMFYENWASQGALDEHMQTPHLKNLVAKAEELFAEPIDVSLWKMIG